MLDESGFQKVDQPEAADILIMNTCGCLETLQEKARQAIQKGVGLNAKQESKQAKKIIVAGCYPLIDKGNNLAELGIEFFPPGEVEELKKILGLSEQKTASPEIHSLYSDDLNNQPGFVTKPVKFYQQLKKIENKIGLRSPKLHTFFKSIMMTSEFHYVVVGKGCMGNCTFCGIKLAIGNPASRPLNEIINNIRKGIVNGKKDIWLVSDDVGCWGQDLGSNSAELLKQILLIPSPMNLVINYFEPEMLLEQKARLLNIFRDPRLIQICLPLQTGSQALLKKMGRHYDIAEVLETILEIRKLNPLLVIKTQYIVSFPTETWREFFLTLWSMRFFDGVGVNVYARLKYTPAYRLKPNPQWVDRTRGVIAKAFATLIHLRFVARCMFQWQKGIVRESE